LFVVRHVGTARLDSLDTFVSTRSTRRTCRVVSSRAKWNLGYTDEPTVIISIIITRQARENHQQLLDEIQK